MTIIKGKVKDYCLYQDKGATLMEAVEKLLPTMSK